MQQSIKLHKYTLQEDVHVLIGIKPPTDIITSDVSLLRGGRLIIKQGYQWDGPKCRGFWCKNAIRGALIHSVLYKLMQEQHIPSNCKEVADKTLLMQCIDDGTPSIVARLLYSMAKREKLTTSKQSPFKQTSTNSVNSSNC